MAFSDDEASFAWIKELTRQRLDLVARLEHLQSDMSAKAQACQVDSGQVWVSEWWGPTLDNWSAAAVFVRRKRAY